MPDGHRAPRAAGLRYRRSSTTSSCSNRSSWSARRRGLLPLPDGCSEPTRPRFHCHLPAALCRSLPSFATILVNFLHSSVGSCTVRDSGGIVANSVPVIRPDPRLTSGSADTPIHRDRPRAGMGRAHDELAWWRDAVIYEVYARSFADGNGDGIGDLAGVRSRLPYLVDLGSMRSGSRPGTGRRWRMAATTSRTTARSTRRSAPSRKPSC